MIHSRVIWALGLLAPPILAFADPSVPAGSASAAFPLGTLSFWEYSGNGQFGGNTSPSPVTMRMDVIETFHRANIDAAWVRGNPMGLMNAAGGDHVIATVADRIYIVQPPRTAQVLQRLRDPNTSPDALLTDTDLLMRVPLAVGAKVCGEGDHCWVVVSEKPPVNKKLSAAGNEFEITSKGLAGSSTIRFVPGVGITGFEFQRNQSREWARVALSDYYLSPD